MIKKTLFLTLFIFTPYFFSTPVLAQKTIAECEKVQSKIKKHSIEKQSRCLDGVIKKFEQELQTWINNHVFNLEEKALITGRYAALKMFKRSQKDFITFRNNDCRWQYLAISPDKGANIAYKKCYIVVTQSRINELSNIP